MKKICLFIFVYFIAIGVFADFVPVKEAEKVARSYFYQSNPKSIGWDDIQLNLIVDPSQKSSEFKFYAFDVNNNEGWIIISSDYNIQPVLAYSYEGQFNEENMAPAQKALFDYYSQSIEYASKNPEAKSSKNLAKWENLLTFDPVRDSRAKATTSPILLGRIKWNQDWPYNGSCPTVNTGGSEGRVYVGCVATAMLMVMKYYNWPPSGTGSASNPYGGTNHSVNFSYETYNWYAMPDEATVENDELGKINYHAGIALKMGWGGEGSGTQTDYIPSALKSNFKYAASTTIRSRYTVSESQWIGYIKAEIDARRPTIYKGTSTTVGHAWVCDGYREDGEDVTFHMNWGWGGSGNGYCTVNELMAPGLPGGPEDNFVNAQQIIVGIVPNAEYSSLCSDITTITGYDGTFNSGDPRYNYQANRNCTYVIKPSCGKIVKCKFTKFELAANDVVEVYSGDENSTDLLGTYNSTNVPTQEFTSEEGIITIKFKTSASSEGAEGWTVEYSTVTCNATTLFTNHSGTFDDGSASCKYQKRLDCLWRIEPEGGTDKILLVFDNFDLAARDLLKIYKNTETPANIVGDYDIDYPPTESLLVESDVVLVRFKSQNSSTLADGWKITYSTSNSITNQDGSISDLYITPNPGDGNSKLVFSMKKNADTRIFVTNVIGEIISERNVNSVSGTNEVYLNEILNKNLNSGIYYVNIQVESQIISTKYVVINN